MHETGKAGAQKIASLSFIKGAACFIVAGNHFFNLYPVRCFGLLYQIKWWFTNGSYMVYIFLAISFFLSSLKVYENENFCIGRETMKRYIRLLLPVMLMYTIVYLMKQHGLFGSLEYALELSGGGERTIDYTKVTSLSSMYKTAVISTLFRQTNDYVFTFWMLYMVLCGGIVSQIFSEMFVFCSDCGKVIAALLVTAILWKIKPFYAMCSLASVSAYCYHRQYALPGAEGILCGLFAVCMGFRRGQTEFDWLLYVAGATAAVVFAANSRMMDKICQNRFTVLLEEISFPVYLLHQPLSASFCAILYIKMASKWGNGIAVNMGLAVCYFTALILLAWFWIKFVSKNLHVTEVHLLKLLTHNEKES